MKCTQFLYEIQPQFVYKYSKTTISTINKNIKLLIKLIVAKKHEILKKTNQFHNMEVLYIMVLEEINKTIN